MTNVLNANNKGDRYAWPDWDGALGMAPEIRFREPPDQGYVEKLNEVLTNLNKLSRVPKADVLRAQLSELSGMTINIVPQQGREQADLRPMTTAPLMGIPPTIHFNPDAWGRYPVKGAEVVAPGHYGLPDWTLPATQWPASMHYREIYSEYGIAPPEQMMLHELGHYAYFQMAYQLTTRAATTPLDEAEAQATMEKARQLLLHGKDEALMDARENLAMKSALPEYRERDGRYHYGEAIAEGREGLPVVAPEDRAALEVALKVHPVNQVPEKPEEVEVIDRNASSPVRVGLAPDAERQHSSVINEQYDRKSRLLIGFDIESPTTGVELLHVDVSQYSPEGKSVDETRQIRQLIRDNYAISLHKDPAATHTFDMLAQDFPKGIAWYPPVAENAGHSHGKPCDVLQMHGSPNAGVGDENASLSMAQAFRRWHEMAAGIPQQGSRLDSDLNLNLSPEKKVAEAVRFIQSLPESQQLPYMAAVAAYAQHSGLRLMETQVNAQSQELTRG